MDYYSRILGADTNNGEHDTTDYDEVTELEWAMYELSTIVYDFKVHPIAASRIIGLLQRVSKNADT